MSPNNTSTGSQGIGAGLSVRGDSVGAYFYRSADGTGTFSSTGVKLRWYYEANGIGCNLGKYITELKVFAIEMVYIPQGAFYLGSGGSETANFYTYGTSNHPYYVTSENEITVDSANGNLYYNQFVNGGDRSGPIASDFPKGFNAFYCMKYEITQGQYVDFLNTLTLTQKVNRFMNKYGQDRNYIREINNQFGCDANNNSILNESDDGQNIACNWMDWDDGISYSDWSGLRPMTELEFEKISRGTIAPVINENAWGSTMYVNAGTSISNILHLGMANEGSNISGANCNVFPYPAYSLGVPLRVGCFASATSNRENSGASYYGAMEMSGNLYEQCVTVGNASGRAFTGINGDGEIAPNASANTIFWPDLLGAGGRGGSIWWSWTHSLSTRFHASPPYGLGCAPGTGFRCVGGL